MTKTELISFVERAATHDTKAIEALYKYTYPGAYSLTNHLCANQNDVEDILQESYFTAFSRLETLRDKAAFPSWLKKIVINTWRTYAKDKSNAYETVVYDADAESFDDMQYAESALDTVEISETNRELNALVEQLPQNQRVCVVLYYYEDMKIGEIAETLGIPEGSVKSRLYYGRRQLRQHIEQTGLNSVTSSANPAPEAAANPLVLAKVLAALTEGAEGSAVIAAKTLGLSAAAKWALGLMAAVVVGGTVGTAVMWPRGQREPGVPTMPPVTGTSASAVTTTTAAQTTTSVTTTTASETTATTATTTTALPEPYVAFDYERAGDGVIITDYSGTASEVVIPETLDGLTVTAVGDSAFQRRQMLTDVVIPSTVKTVGSNAFRECRSLRSVTLGNGVNVIGGSAFLGCSSLGSVRIPGSVRVIDSYAFAYCTGLSYVEMAEGVETVGYSAFRECGALMLAELPSTVQSIGNDSFDGASAEFTITAPEDTYAYEYAANKGFLE